MTGPILAKQGRAKMGMEAENPSVETRTINLRRSRKTKATLLAPGTVTFVWDACKGQHVAVLSSTAAPQIEHRKLTEAAKSL